MSSDGLPKIPNLAVAQYKFLLQNGPPESQAEAKSKILEAIKADDMAPFYKLTAEELKWTLDSKIYDAAAVANEAELKRLEDKLNDAETNLGETDISDALIAKADYLAKIGEKVRDDLMETDLQERALTAYRTALEKTGPLGARIDMVFAIIRIGFFFSDNDLISKNIEKARTLIEEGGDWDRRNRLKVYEAIYKISIRDFKGAVDSFLDTLATFTSSELMDYKDFVRYAVLTAALTLKRPDFKKKVVNAPEILEVINEIPILPEFVNSDTATIEQQLKLDRYLNSHYRFYVREMRIIAYSQILESYRSLAIESMANSFGVTEEFIDNDLSRFIAAGRLNAVIDKVGGIVETNRPDAKNAQYQASIKQGDILLNRIQKLSRVITV
ncbi:26S proteasome non-ATPase regulatory subunit 6 [Phlyctochytrium bullatum]|nr:26S proteasome non-ATPase regulatory subunit 6 [Phlyctochytrium bullatum]